MRLNDVTGTGTFWATRLCVAFFVLTALLLGSESVALAVETGSIGGTITDDVGVPLAGIDALAYVYDAGWGYWDWWYSSTSASDGSYRISGLAADQYRVGFQDWQGDTYLGQYYPGVASIDEAQDITVAAGQETTGIDAVMQVGGSISGSVTDAEGVALEAIYADVYTYQHDEEWGGWWWYWRGGAMTAEDGTYLVGALYTDQYRVRFEDWYSDTYLGQCYPGVASIDEAQDIAVTAGAETAGIDAVMQVGGSISGSVTDAEGTPLAGIGIAHYSLSDEWGHWDWLGSTETSQTGSYRISRLAADQYRVRFEDWYGGTYVSQYYPGVASIDEAQDVTVTAGAEATGIDAVMQVGGSISGSVTDAEGTPLAGMGVRHYAFSDEWGYWDWMGSTETSQTGSYRISRLAADRYRLGFDDRDAGSYLSQYYPGVASIDEAHDITVTAGEEMTGIDAVMQVGGSISGTVTDAEGTPLEGIGVGHYTFADKWGHWNWRGSTETSQTGSYRIGALVPDQYRVGFEDWNGGTYLSQYYPGVATIEEAQDIIVSVGEETTGIDAVMQVGGSISGTVRSDEGNPVSGIRLWALRYDEWDGSWEWMAGAYSDEGGIFSVSPLETGRYALGTFDYGYQWYVTGADFGDPTKVVQHDVVQGEDLPGVEVVLTRGGRITGDFTSDAGSALHRVDVYVQTSDGWSWVAYQEGGQGAYSIGGLETGDYRLQYSWDADWDWGNGGTFGWYSNANGLLEATDVRVVFGETTGGIDFHGSSLAAGSITGTVTDAVTTEAVGGIHVSLFSSAGDLLVIFVTELDGTYSFSGIRSGTYYVAAPAGGLDSSAPVSEYTPTFGSGPTPSPQDSVLVEDSSTATKNFALTVGETITGVLVDEDGAPLAGSNVEIKPASSAKWYAWAQPFTPDVFARAGVTDEQGSYSVGGLVPGEDYVVCFKGWGPGHVEEYSRQLYDRIPFLSGTGKPVPAGSAGIDAVMFRESDIKALEGSVTGPDGAALESVVDVRLWYESGDGSWVPEYLSGYVTRQGTFEFSGWRLFPGVQKVQFVSPTGTYQDSFYGGATLETAEPVVVSSGGVTTLPPFALSYKATEPGNTAPVASNDAYAATEEVALSVPAPGVLANDTDADGDTLTAHLLTNVSNGTLALSPNGSFLYTPTPGFVGTDTFTYRAYDGTAYSAAATVTITVAAAPGEPSTIDIQHDAAGVTFDRWVTGYSTAYSGGGYVYGRWTGTEITAKFTGSKVRWVGPKQPAYGMADVYIDGVLVAEDVDCYAPDAEKTLSAVIWESGTLADGPHTLSIRLKGAKNPASTSNVVVIDRFEVDGAAPAGAGTRIDDTTASPGYAGAWIQLINPTYYNKTYAYSRWAAHSFTATFEGTGVAWIGPRTTNYGMADIYIDDVKVATVDAYRANLATQGWREVVWESGALSPGTHTIKIVPTGTKNPSSTKENIVIDAIDVRP